MRKGYYVAVNVHNRTVCPESGDVSWTCEELEQWDEPCEAKARADELNEQYRTPDKFHAATMVWL
ncbi:hypothetical protein PODOV061v2_0062 [Vibrio phage 172P1]|nr:hypothetical protein PODOV061v2_0062 [Vibrio phage 172P1]